MSFSQWDEVLLGDIAEDVTVGFVGSMANEYVEYGIPFLRSLNVEPFNILKGNMKYIDEKFHGKLKKSSLKPGDVVIVRTGKPGSCAVIPEWLKVANCSDLVIVRPGKFVDSRFLSYYINTISTGHINAHLVGAVQQHFNVASAKTIKLKLPPMEEQKSIADTLSCIDNKIELNNRMNQNLEEMAKTIFRSWFVDFEPFQDGEFEESELGMIPKGWRVARIGETCRCILGGTPSRKEAKFWNGRIPWINSGKVNDYRIIEASEHITELGMKKSATSLLPLKTTVLAITGATLGQVSLMEISSCANQSVIGILENEDMPYEYIYLMICNHIKGIISHQTGGAQQHINKSNVESERFIVPNSKVLDDYVSAVSELFQIISKNCFETKKLHEMRDLLLPKLMAGELRVPIEEVN